MPGNMAFTLAISGSGVWVITMTSANVFQSEFKQGHPAASSSATKRRLVACGKAIWLARKINRPPLARRTKAFAGSDTAHGLQHGQFTESTSCLALAGNPLSYQCLHHLIIYIWLMRSWLSRFQFRATAFLLLALWFAPVAPVRAMGEVADNKGIVPHTLDPYISPTNGLGSWIWADKTMDGQTCQLWKSIEIPASSTVTKARLLMTVDNEFTLFLDGRELGRGSEWRELFVFDLTRLLPPGKHVLAVRGLNSFSFAGMLFGLRVVLADGRIVEVKSDQSWRIVPDGVSRWEKKTEASDTWPAATIKAALGGSPWWTQPVNVNVMPTLQPIKVFFWQTGWFQISLLVVCGLVILISLRLMAQLALHQKERWLLQQERARIARDIHDDIGSRMTQLVLHGEVAQSDLPDDSKMRPQLDRICEEARGLLSSMDEILWAVNPRRDTLRDFAAYVCGYAQQFLKATPIQCLFEVDPEMSAAAFDLPLRRSLLMAIKETLNNAVKHSKATELQLKIHWQGHRLVVVVQDNGQGFDMEKMKSGRNGLANIAQRMTELGGSCLVTSQPGKGCRVEFSIPLKHLRRHPWAWIWNAKQFSEQINEARNARTNEPSQNHDPTKC
jgi:signal transduction histidine kinase